MLAWDERIDFLNLTPFSRYSCGVPLVFNNIIFVLKAGDLPQCTLELPARVKPRTFSFYNLFLLTELMTHDKGPL